MWARVDDNFLIHERTRGLSAAAVAMYVGGLSYAGRMLTDGLLPANMPDMVCACWRVPTPRRAVAELEEHGLWIQEGDGWRVHDFLQYNKSREEVLADREKWGALGGKVKEQARERQRRYRQRKREEQATLGNVTGT